MKLNRLHAALVTTTALVAASALAPLPAAAFAPTALGGAVFIIMPGPTATSATVAMQMPNGVPIPIETLNPTTGKLIAVGLGQPKGAASLGSVGTVPSTQLPIGTAGGVVGVAGPADTKTVKTPTGSVSATEAFRWDNALNLKSDFGAKGDSTTDDTPAFQNAINALAISGAYLTGGHAVIRLPCGNYVIAGNLTTTVSSGKSLVVQGEARDCVKLTFTGQTGDGWTVNYGSATSSFNLWDVNFTTDTDTSTSRGIVLVGAAGNTNPAGSARSEFRRVTFRGADGRLVVQHWGTLIHATNVSNIDFNQVDGYGAGTSSTTTAQGIIISGQQGTSCDGGDCYVVSFNFDKGNFNGFDKAISMGYAAQGLFVNGTNWNSVNYGVYVPSGLTGVDGITVIGAPGASAKIADVAVLSTQARDVIVKGGYFVLNTSGGVGVRTAGIGTIVEGVGLEGIIGKSPGAGIDLIDGATGTIGIGNFYSNLPIAIAESAGTSNNYTGNDTFSGVTTQVADLGTTNTNIEPVTSIGRLRVQSGSSTAGPSVQLNGTNATVNRVWNMGAVANGQSGATTGGGWWLYDATANLPRIYVDTAGNVGVGTSLGLGAKLDVQGSTRVSGHTLTGSTAPALSSCGTSPTISGSDSAGLITTGAGATSCTATFATVYAARPYCTVTGESAAVTYSVTKSAITIAAGAYANVDYQCSGQAGG